MFHCIHNQIKGDHGEKKPHDVNVIECGFFLQLLHFVGLQVNHIRVEGCHLHAAAGWMNKSHKWVQFAKKWIKSWGLFLKLLLKSMDSVDTIWFYVLPKIVGFSATNIQAPSCCFRQDLIKVGLPPYFLPHPNWNSFTSIVQKIWLTTQHKDFNTAQKINHRSI